MDLSKIDLYKRFFLKVARTVCPDFTVRPEMRKLLNDLVRYCTMLPSDLDTDKGLWLWGNIGTGKSTMLEIVRRYSGFSRPTVNQLPYSFNITNAIKVCAHYQKDGYSGLDQFIERPRQAFDEIGSETLPTSYYGNPENVFQYILQRRYDLRFSDPTAVTHVTTNLSPEQIADIYGPRIYDRCKEMFNFVCMPGATFRKLSTSQNPKQPSIQ